MSSLDHPIDPYNPYYVINFRHISASKMQRNVRLEPSCFVFFFLGDHKGFLPLHHHDLHHHDHDHDHDHHRRHRRHHRHHRHRHRHHHHHHHLHHHHCHVFNHTNVYIYIWFHHEFTVSTLITTAKQKQSCTFGSGNCQPIQVNKFQKNRKHPLISMFNHKRNISLLSLFHCLFSHDNDILRFIAVNFTIHCHFI